MEEKKIVSIDLSTPILMTLVFLLLKCADVIDWNWWWIFSPMYIFIGLLVITFAIFGISDIVSYMASFLGRRGGGDAT